METPTMQSSILLSNDSIASSIGQCPESSTALVKAKSVVKDGTQKKLQKPILLSLSPAPPPMDADVSRKRSISGVESAAERQKSNKATERHVRTPIAVIRFNPADQTDNALHIGVGDFSLPRFQIATPNAKEKRKSSPRPVSPFLKESKRLPPIKVPLHSSLMKFGSDAILPQLRPSQPPPNSISNTPRYEKINVVVTNEREKAVPIDVPTCNMEVDRGVPHANSESVPDYDMTKLLFEEIADRSISSDSIGMEDSPSKDIGIEEGAEEEGGIKGETAKVLQSAERTTNERMQEASTRVFSEGVRSFFPPDEELIRKAAKLRGKAQPCMHVQITCLLSCQERALLPS